jgi:hypothetical protein
MAFAGLASQTMRYEKMRTLMGTARLKRHRGVRDCGRREPLDIR